MSTWWENMMQKRRPDVVIGGPDNPYLHRWYMIPRNPVLNVYLHKFLRSDDDRALHDHPWVNLSVLLRGEYTEHTIAAGGVNYRKVYRTGDWKFRWPTDAHRIELHDGSSISLFVTGPRVRTWGFHCPNSVGWRRWTDFVSNYGEIGKGCDP